MRKRYKREKEMRETDRQTERQKHSANRETQTAK